MSSVPSVVFIITVLLLCVTLVSIYRLVATVDDHDNDVPFRSIPFTCDYCNADPSCGHLSTSLTDAIDTEPIDD